MSLGLMGRLVSKWVVLGLLEGQPEGGRWPVFRGVPRWDEGDGLAVGGQVRW